MPTKIHPVLTKTRLPGVRLSSQGKVRDVYETGDGQLLIVATDRLSAFDVVMPQPIPLKGRVLTQLSNFWFSFTHPIIENHLVCTQVEDFPRECQPYADHLRGRSILVKKTRPLPIECVVRGYLSGSGWIEYQQSGTVCGIALPKGLVESAKLPEPIFTPATKAEVGHDENIDFEKASDIAGREYTEMAKKYALAIYKRTAEYAEARGIIIADTKMEFGLCNGALILIDEVLTPDSSRFWPREKYHPGGPQESFDKQFVRDYLLSVNFNKRPPGPVLPSEVIEKTSRLYSEALRLLTGRDPE